MKNIFKIKKTKEMTEQEIKAEQKSNSITLATLMVGWVILTLVTAIQLIRESGNIYLYLGFSAVFVSFFTLVAVDCVLLNLELRIRQMEAQTR